MGVDIQTYSVTFTSDVLTSEDAPSPSHQVYIYTPNFFFYLFTFVLIKMRKKHQEDQISKNMQHRINCVLVISGKHMIPITVEEISAMCDHDYDSLQTASDIYHYLCCPAVSHVYYTCFGLQ